MQMKQVCLLLVLFMGIMGKNFAQCDSLLIEDVDDFDSTLLVTSLPISIGYMIPSQFETIDGFKLVEEGKLLISFTENDSIEAFFLTLAIQEREYVKIKSDKNVLLQLSNNQILGLLNVADKGEFDRTTNMRRYQHTCVVPYDQLFNLSYHTIQQIRIMYEGGYYHDVKLTLEQQEFVRESVKCLAERMNLLTVKP
jgi:hypothetical protein